MNTNRQVLKYLIADYISAVIAWGIFFSYRKIYLEPLKYGIEIPLLPDRNFYLGLIFIPAFWLSLYALNGNYNTVYRKHRLHELGQTLFITLVGVIILFFTLLIDDEIASYKNYYDLVVGLYGIHFSLTYILRLLITSSTVHKIHNRKIGFNTIIVGGNQQALDIYNEIEGYKQSPGNKFVGFVSINGGDHILQTKIPYFGTYHKLKSVIEEQKIEEVIIAIESSEHEEIEKILNKIEGLNILIKIIPDMYDIMAGSVKMSGIFGVPLIEVRPEIMNPFQKNMKRGIDLSVSILALILLSPVFFFLALIVKLTSKGPVFFKQERIGLHGKPFKIYKFRTMYIDAELNGPQLSSSNDNRITGIGKFLRKTRLDEIPQFFNVIKGEMALVGPRPERQFFIDQIIVKAPHYVHLHKVKPGITSWGQVKFGYAENVEQMIQRLKFDILYIENMSLAIDLKILIYTILTVIKGDGK